MRPNPVIPIVLFAASDLAATAAVPDAVAELGRALFEDGRLSIDGTVSCATCHDPARSFADGAPESKGVLGVVVGRNTPTLWGLDTVDSFPIEGRAGHGVPSVRSATLAERCIAPIENPLEMALVVDTAVRRLNEDLAMRDRFSLAFGAPHGGATRDRMGEALAAYVRTLKSPTSPYSRALDGDESALTVDERAGLSIFETRGQCASCHSGPGLTDGRMHIVTPADERGHPRESRKARSKNIRKMRAATRAAKKRDVDHDLQLQLTRSIQSGGYGGTIQPRPDMQTLTLWDVSRTGPYFRDGSVPDLEEAVRTHVRRLRESGPEAKEREATLRSLAASRETANQAPQFVLGALALPESLTPAEPEDRPRVPAQLTDAEIEYLMHFLRSLSPREHDPVAKG